MVERQTDVSGIFHALAHEARRDILSNLAAGERTVSELAEPLNMSLAAASKHVKVLEETGLLQRSIVGRTHVCRLNPVPLARADAWLRFYEQFWSTRLDALDELVHSEPQTQES